MPQRVAIVLAEGFEETEAIAVIDVLRRAAVEVLMAAAQGPPGPVRGSHQITVLADTSLPDLQPAALAMVILPGGMPGSSHLAANRAVLDLLRAVHRAGGTVAAICAAPIALQAAGLLAGRRVTCYPGFERQLAGAVYTGATVEQDGRIVTSRGPGTALRFALELLRVLGHDDQAEQLRQGMLVEA